MAKNKKSNTSWKPDINFAQIFLGALLTLIAYNGRQINNDVGLIKTDVTQVKGSQELTTKDIEFFKQEFVSLKENVQINQRNLQEPRFTENNFKQGIEPIVKQLNENTDELNLRSNSSQKINNEILRLQLRVEDLEK